MTKPVRHPFEHFGPAPYRIVRVAEQVHIVPGVSVRAAGSCDVCGTCIRWAYTVRAGNGAEFVTGSDCAQKCGMTAASIREARRAERSERYRLEDDRRREARLDEQRAIVFAEHGVHLTFTELREARAAGRAAAWAWLAAERRLNARHIGEVGKRARGLELLVERTYACEPGPYGTTVIWTLRDRAGNCLVYKSTTSLYSDTDGRVYRTQPRESRWFVCDATVKEHGKYKGLKQTVIQRVRIKSVASDWILV